MRESACNAHWEPGVSSMIQEEYPPNTMKENVNQQCAWASLDRGAALVHVFSYAFSFNNIFWSLLCSLTYRTTPFFLKNSLFILMS